MTVELSENPRLCSVQGVKKFPYLQIYRNVECVASFSTGPAHNFRTTVGKTIQDKLSNTDWEKLRSDFTKEIAEGLEKIRLLRLENIEEEEFSEVSP